MTDNRRQEEQKFPTHEQIEQRAHELYLARGDKGRLDLEDGSLLNNNCSGNTVSELAPEQRTS
jgi:hypothetical protein